MLTPGGTESNFNARRNTHDNPFRRANETPTGQKKKLKQRKKRVHAKAQRRKGKYIEIEVLNLFVVAFLCASGVKSSST
ncbi:MAG TPA: hypothetical protein VIQ24_22570 [Pyrinomonadaceae bacterium]